MLAMLINLVILSADKALSMQSNMHTFFCELETKKRIRQIKERIAMEI